MLEDFEQEYRDTLLKELREIKAIKRSKTESNSALDDSIGEFEIKNIETEVASIKGGD